MVEDNIIIWGTGLYGRTAYCYYQGKCNILGYIDNDQRKWGYMLNDIEIYPPDVLNEKHAKVVIALKKGVESIQRQLSECYGIEQYILFKLEEQNINITHKDDNGLNYDSIIVCFSGGLGNQMFQYALLRNYELCEKAVYGDLSAYSQIGQRKFSLLEVFPDIRLTLCSEEQKKEFVYQNAYKCDRGKKSIFYTESSINEASIRRVDFSLLDIECGIIKGFHQFYQFPQKIRETLIRDFRFPILKEMKLQKLAEIIMKNDFVSVHVRRGDYLHKDNEWVFGNICTIDYYNRAIEYIREKAGNCKFCFFSNDINWIKDQFDLEGAICIEEGMFEQYQDWYDMYLMSICKHNIVANSTFSWWGAWLNTNDDKIVIAPQKWMNRCDIRDICPPEWIRL